MRRLDDLSALEARLADLASSVESPSSPPLRDAVLARLRSAAPAPALDRPRRAILVLVAIITALGASFAVPQWRNAVAGWLGIHGVTIEQRPGPLPTLPATPTPGVSLTPGPPGSHLDLGDPTTLAAARQRLPFAPLVPSSLGTPDATWLRVPPAGGALSLVYLLAPGRPPAGPSGVSILVTEFRADLDTQFLGKLVGSDATVTQVGVRGEAGVWIAGAPHQLVFRDADGNFKDDSLRLATNTLLWQHGSVLVRLEGAQSLEQAQAIAASMS